MFEVTFTFQGTKEEVDLIVNRIIENHEPVGCTEPVEVEADEELDFD